MGSKWINGRIFRLIRTDHRRGGAYIYRVLASIPGVPFVCVGDAFRSPGNDRSPGNGGKLSGWAIEWDGDDDRSPIADSVRLIRHGHTFNEGGLRDLRARLGIPRRG